MLPRMKQIELRPFIVAALLVAVTGCAAVPRRGDTEMAEADVAMADSGGGRMSAMAAAMPAPEPSPTDTTNNNNDVEQATSTPVDAPRRLVIYTGSVSSLVAQVEPALAAFLAKVSASGGYLQNRSGGSVTVRVPASQFFTTLQWLRESGQVSDEQINAVDVTKQVFDIELRLQTADEARKRLLKLLESASKIEDILAIETQLRRLTDEIEGMKGELRHLSDQIALSTLTVNFYANAPVPNPYPRRTRSRFEWINQVGIENVMESF
jgi:hypothetical protein